MTFIWDSEDIDESTGLPRLPEDHFWRIEPSSFGLTMVNVMRRRRGWFPKYVGGTYLHYAEAYIWKYVDGLDDPLKAEYDPENLKDHVRVAAKLVVIDLRDEQDRASIQDLFGDYPPKVLTNDH